MVDNRNNRGGFPNDAGSPVMPADEASQAALDAMWWPILLAGHVGTGIESGAKLQSLIGGRTVNTAAGVGRLLGSKITLPATQLSVAANATHFRRFDLVLYRGSESQLRVVQGAADEIPCFPQLETDPVTGELTDVVLGAVLCRPGFTDITNVDLIQLGVPPATGLAGDALPMEFTLFRGINNQILTWANTCSMKGPNTSATLQDNIVTDPRSGDQFATLWNAGAQPVLLAKASYDTWFTYYTDPGGPNQSDDLAAASAANACRFWHMPPHTANDGTVDAVGKGLQLYDNTEIGGGDPDFVAGHSFLSMGIDLHSRLHISGNEHGVPLTCVRTSFFTDWKGVRHASIPSISNANFVGGAQENTATYPRFFYMKDGTMFFTFRNGTSSSGDHWMYKWNDAAGTWSSVPIGGGETAGVIINGDLNSVNAYPNHLMFDKQDRLHVFFVWRQTGAPFNQGVYYFRLDNLVGTPTAHRADDTAITLPIRYAQGGHVAERPATVLDGGGTDPSSTPPYSGNLLNGGGACVDALDNPHAAWNWHDTLQHQQIHHVWHDGTNWHTDRITNFQQAYQNNGGGGGDFLPYPRPAVVCDNAGKTYIVAAWQNERLADKLWCWDVSPGSTDYNPFPLLDLPDLGEITYDSLALRDHNVLRFLVMTGTKRWLNPGDSNGVGPNTVMGTGDHIWPIDNFPAVRSGMASAQGIAGVATIDLDQMPAFRARMVQLPHIKTVMSAGASTLPHISQSTAQAFNGSNATQFQPASIFAIVDSGFAPGTAPRLVIGDHYRNKLLFARQSCTFHSVGTWLAVGVHVVPTAYMNPWGQRLVDASPPGNHGLDNDIVYACVHCSDGQANLATKSSEWVPLVNMLDETAAAGLGNGNIGYVEQSATVGSTAGGTLGVLSASVMEIGVLEGETVL